MNHYVCNECGHLWVGEHVGRCPACNYTVANLWQGDGAAANAKAQSLRIQGENARETA